MATTLSSLIKNNQIPAAVVTTVLQNALLEIFADGYAYPCQVTDYAATPNAGTAILAATSLTNFALPAVNVNSPANATTVQDATGNLYQLVANSTTNGISVQKFSAAGVLQGSLSIDATAVAVKVANIAILSNGNIFVTYYLNTNGFYYAIFAPALTVVVAATALQSTYVGSALNALSSVPLTAGGFAAFYNTAATTMTLAIYNNAGVLQGSATVTTGAITTYAGNAIAQLSNGNVVIGYASATPNVTFAIYNTSAVQQVAPTTGVAGGNAGSVGFSVLSSGFFAIGGQVTAGSCSIGVYSNAGAQQGSTATVAGTGTGGSGQFGITNDGTNFWMIGTATTGTFLPAYTKITTAGAATTYVAGVQFGSGYSVWISFYDNCGNITTIATNGSITQYTTFNINLLVQTTAPATIATSVPSNQSAIMLGDAAVAISGGAVSGACNLSIWKCANSAIIGPAQAAAAGTVAASAQIQVVVASGYYPINRLKGTASKAFTMKTVANLYGNNGSMSGIGASLQGM